MVPPPNRVRQAWSDASGELPPPMPATVERAIEELGDEPTVTRVVVATYEVMTASRLAKAQSRWLAPDLAKAASISGVRGREDEFVTVMLPKLNLNLALQPLFA